MNDELLKFAQEEYDRQLQEYLTKPLKKPISDLLELTEKYFTNISNQSNENRKNV